MSVVSPIEHLAMAPKSLQTSIQNVNKIQRQEAIQAEQAASFQNQVKKNAEQTVKSQKSETEQYRFDQKKEDRNKGYQGNKQEKKSAEECDPDDVSKRVGQSFDICI